MRALITNDDGIDSPGLAVLARVAQEAGFEVTVAAPARESSGASASLLGAEQDGRLLVEKRDCPGCPDGVRSLAVRAAPGLIGFVAAHEGFGPRPDLVLSGVNRGSNTGHAVIHSGTVGAALSAATHHIPAMAVSLASASPKHWATAGAVAAHVLPWVLAGDATKVLNVNVPDRRLERIRGLRKAPLASFGTVQARVHAVDKGNLMVTYAEIDPSADAESDAGLLAAGWATLTLLDAPCYMVDADLPELEGPPPQRR
jgi:5'-nucleotidase